jgi:hypothetical protein
MLTLDSYRRYLRCAAATVVLLLASCGGISPGGFSGDVDLLLARGEDYVSGLSSQPLEQLSDADIVALGYIERARLGLGSPFRLVEYILRDPNLPEDVQTLTAYGILARTLDGATYIVDPRVLDMAHLSGVSPERQTGFQQLALIERAIETAPTATAGERTVRLAYLLAASERTVDPAFTSVVAHVAAMLGDRRRSQEDVTLLFRTATRTRQDPLVIIRNWRRDLRFSVEQPQLMAISVREEEAEARDGPILALALRSLAQRLSAPRTLVGDATTPDLPNGEPLLSGPAAERLQALAEKRNYPAQAPIAVAVEINRDGLVLRQNLRSFEREARERFTRESWNEERLAAGAAILHAAGADDGQRPPLVLLQAATFLRVWNQEEVWFPGDPSPKPRDLEARYGIAAVRFDDDIDDSWHPYYLRMLARSVADLQRVLPTVSVRGMTVVIGDLPGEARALALHEPRSRTLYLPPGSGAGTLAHEMAHDLDWQLARKRYGARGGYATDMAVRNNRRDRIAVAMMELSTSLVQPATGEEPTAHLTRPAEVFARGVDWLVAALMARDGRLGGYLTSFQDPVLTGYGTTRGPDITGGAVPALLSILDGIAPVADSTRTWALDTYGPSRSLQAMELARAVSQAGMGLPAEHRMIQIRDVGMRSFQAVSDCRYGSADGVRRLVAAQRSLAEASVSAAARGAAIDAIHDLAAEYAGRSVRPAVDAWIAWRVYGAPEPVGDLLVDLAPAFEDLLLQASLPQGGHSIPSGPNAFRVVSVPTMCGGNPFAADTPVGRFRTSGGGASS